MKKIVLIMLSLIMTMSLFGCSNQIVGTAYNDLITHLEKKDFKVIVEDVEEDILQGQRKWLTINENKNISVYLYENSDKMEEDSSYLSKDGFTYDNGKEIKSISWSSYPHFFKKDNMIVLYVGENLEIINLLEETMGLQFSGETKEYLSDRRPMVMINGELYLDTNRESDLNGRCGVMDGEISSAVDGSEIPTQDNQSNFGDGYEYQYVGENSIDIYMNEKWIRFEKEITDAWGIRLTASNVTDSKLTLVCEQSGGQPIGDLQTGSYYFLEKHVDNQWLPVEMLPSAHEVGWTDQAWIIPMNDTVQWDVDWAWLYGELPVGGYRIGKEIMGFRGSGNYDTSIYYANFEVTN